MKKWPFAALVGAVVIVSSLLLVLLSPGETLNPLVPVQPSAFSPSPTLPPSPSPTVMTSPSPSVSPSISKYYNYSVVNSYPHDPSAFTQGLVFVDGVLYESTGEYGFSTLRRVDLTSGNVTQMIGLSDIYFGEGITIVNGKIFMLTWMNNIGFVYDKESFGLLGNFSYPTQGWGITYNGSQLIMTDGTSNLYFLDPLTFQRVGQVSVHDDGIPITNINEIEFIKGDVYANIWLQQKIAIINPQTGQVKAWIDLTGIYNSNNANSVLNGIAYDSNTDRLFITGKNWPILYEIKIVPKS